MRRWSAVFASAVVSMVIVSAACVAGPGAKSPTDTSVDSAVDLVFPHNDGRVTLRAVSRARPTVIVFLGTECRLSAAYIPTLIALHRKYGDAVTFLGVDANVQDTRDAVVAYAHAHHIPFAVAMDVEHRLADALGATRTPEAFLVDGSGAVRYRGRIDDQFGIGFQRAKATREDLSLAIDEVIAKKPVSVAHSPAQGCHLSRPPTADKPAAVTYRNDVADILERNCVECHRPGEIAPMSLTSYEAARNWAMTIREVVVERRMPPWPADPAVGQFENARGLSENDKKTLLDWIASGAPEGTGAVRRTATVPDREEGWRIGRPDLVVKMPEPIVVPAQAPPPVGVPYKYVFVSTDLDEDKWISALEVHADARSVVHHINVGLQYPRERAMGEPQVWTAAWRHRLFGMVPGREHIVFPKGAAKRFPKGSRIVLSLHYTANGAETPDQSSVGFVFSKTPPTEVMMSAWLGAPNLRIPAGADSHEVSNTFKVERAARLWALAPHMHLRGKDFRYELIERGGKTSPLLSVPSWDFNWQPNYVLPSALPLSEGDAIRTVAHFDNSEKNRNNPDPTRDVGWGDQSWDEMMIGVMELLYPREDDSLDDLERYHCRRMRTEPCN